MSDKTDVVKDRLNEADKLRAEDKTDAKRWRRLEERDLPPDSESYDFDDDPMTL